MIIDVKYRRWMVHSELYGQESGGALDLSMIWIKCLFPLVTWSVY